MTPNLREQRFMQGVLGNVRLFAGVTPADLAAVCRQAWVLAARRGDVLAAPESRLPGVFVVGYGLVKLALRTRDGRERVVRIVSAGQSFGEAAALLGRVPGYEARALVDCKLVVVPSVSVYALLDAEPRFARNLINTLARRVVELGAELEAVSLHSSGERLATYLDSLAQPARENGGWTVRLPVSKTLVAARLGMKKETLSRLLRRLSAQGLIEVSRRDIAIPDRDALTRATNAHCERM